MEAMTMQSALDGHLPPKLALVASGATGLPGDDESLSITLLAEECVGTVADNGPDDCDCSGDDAGCCSRSPSALTGYVSLASLDTRYASSEATEVEAAEEDVLSECDRFVRQLSSMSELTQATSRPASDFEFAEPSQTMLIFDWDDTLFPTTEFMERWRLPWSNPSAAMQKLSPEQTLQLEQWRQALREFLEQACTLSERCVIVTNSKRPWVTDCIERFAPSLWPLFCRHRHAPRVVYAGEQLRPNRRRAGQIMDMRPVRNRLQDLTTFTAEEFDEEQTMAKYVAMKSEVSSFYSQYPGQSWKNILSFGDMYYEHHALQELSFRRTPPGRERLRTKSVVLPRAPAITALTLRLQFERLMLPAFVRHDGDLSLALDVSPDALQEIADALQMPELGNLNFSRHAWGCDSAPSAEEVSESCNDLAVFVHGALHL